MDWYMDVLGIKKPESRRLFMKWYKWVFALFMAVVFFILISV